MSTDNTREVPEYLVERIQAIVAKVNKRAAKIGAPGFSLAIGQTFHKPVKIAGRTTSATTPWVKLTISGEGFKINGHEFIGRVDFEEGTTLVNVRPGAVMPSRFRQATTFCDHCKSDRKRNAVFVFKPDAGQHIQVGRSCLKDFIGHDPAATLFLAREYGDIFSEIEDEVERGAGGAPTMLSVRGILAAGAHAVAKHGFVGVAKARENELVATASIVFDYLLDRKSKYKPTAADESKAEAVLAWVKSTFEPKGEAMSDYESNAVELVSRDRVPLRRVGLLVSLVAVYNRSMEERVAREAAINAHVGEIGQRRVFDAVYRGENWFETNYGSSCIARFQTEEGLVVYRGGAPFWPKSVKAGDKVIFTGTIADHGEYMGMRQTKVSRCKLSTPAIH